MPVTKALRHERQISEHFALSCRGYWWGGVAGRAWKAAWWVSAVHSMGDGVSLAAHLRASQPARDETKADLTATMPSLWSGRLGSISRWIAALSPASMGGQAGEHSW